MRLFLLFGFLLSVFSASPALASFERGKLAYDQKNWRVAIGYLRPLAEQGDAKAQIILGNMYAQGYGVVRDPAEAYKLYRKAALQNHAEAMVIVGAMHQQGIGTQKSTLRALEWYKRAADSGHPGGAYFYGLYMFRGNKSKVGNDIKPDLALAYRWFRITERTAKDDKLKESAKILAEKLTALLSAEQLAAENEKAAAWLPVKLEQLGQAPPEKEDLPPEPAPGLLPPPEAPPESPAENTSGATDQSGPTADDSQKP